MACAVSRRQFLRGNLTGRNAEIRPPWAVAENEFVARCDQCSECIAACPSHLIEAANDGLPFMNFLKGECNFCNACARACATGALVYRDEARQPIWSLAGVPHLWRALRNDSNPVCTCSRTRCDAAG